jgi:hypothetical protein
MEPRTREHLSKAAHNGHIASWLLNATPPAAASLPPWDWAIVAAFYAAIHYVNAYLWEARRYQPPNHGARLNAVSRNRALRAAYPSYVRLRGLAFQARYDPAYRPTRADAEDAVQRHLAQVERTVRSALRRFSP